MVQRVLEIMVALHELNNFNGLLAINAAMQASSIYRLQATKDQMNKNLASKAEKYRAYPENRYQELNKRLRKINPPCVPFLGVFQVLNVFVSILPIASFHMFFLNVFFKRHPKSLKHSEYCLSGDHHKMEN